VYLKAYELITHAKKELRKFFDRYNIWRRHQGLGERTPDDVYWSTLPKAKDAILTGAANHLKPVLCCLKELDRLILSISLISNYLLLFEQGNPFLKEYTPTIESILNLNE
jgi:hypothetical protein